MALGRQDSGLRSALLVALLLLLSLSVGWLLGRQSGRRCVKLLEKLGLCATRRPPSRGLSFYDALGQRWQLSWDASSHAPKSESCLTRTPLT